MGLYRESDMSEKRGIEGVSKGYRRGIDRVDESTLWAIYKCIEEHSISNPATRELLRIKTGKDDRVVRMGIEDLRNNHNIKIVSWSGRYGYWLDSKGGGFDRMKAEMRAKAFSILRTLSNMEGELEGQVQWQDIQS